MLRHPLEADMTRIFIDGQAGTTGLELSGRLAAREDISLISIAEHERKNTQTRQEHLQEADLAILCLPDEAAQESVLLAAGRTRILDASTAHRTHPQWTYGLPELSPEQRSHIAGAQFVSNPGCYPQGFTLLVRPLIDAGLLDAHTALRTHAVSGYSGGGRQMIERFDAFDEGEKDTFNSQTYALALQHKHVAEMWTYSKTATQPLFSPMVANFYKGMMVHVPLFIRSELKGAGLSDIHSVYAERYADEPFIELFDLDSQAMLNEGCLTPTAVNDSNQMQLMIFGNADQVMLTARYDNLGKGAAGAAVQNLNIMLGIKETTGL